MEAPATRKPTRATEGTVLRAIFPMMGQVANSTCTAIRARCGAIELFDLALRCTAVELKFRVPTLVELL